MLEEVWALLQAMCVLPGLVTMTSVIWVICLGALVSLTGAEAERGVADIASTWLWELPSCFLASAAKSTSPLCRDDVLCVMMQCVPMELHHVLEWQCPTLLRKALEEFGRISVSCVKLFPGMRTASSVASFSASHPVLCPFTSRS